LHAARTAMIARVALLAVISVSCSHAITPDLPVDAPPGSHHDAATGDAPKPPHDGTLADAPPFSDAPPPCKPPNIIHGDGKHNPTMDCMNGCHDHGFSIAGTLMMADLSTPASNATVTVVDANNFSQDIIAGTNGNFFSFLPVTYPIRITASMCPSTQVMVSQPTSGACNATGCHEPGGVQGLMHL
jgi:hypothetical protein